VASNKGKQHKSDPGAAKWRIRGEKGNFFGPADLETLAEWARDGRIAPSSEISDDGENWQPVTHMPELAMDWVAEVTPGTFYGPVHSAFLDELQQDGSLNQFAARFKRFNRSENDATEQREKDLEERLNSIQQTLYARIAQLENDLSTCRDELEQARGSLAARDLEFDAERQELLAAASRYQAELVKRDGRISQMEKELTRNDKIAKERLELEARITEAESKIATFTRAVDQEKQAAELAKSALRDVEKQLSTLRERQQGLQRELESARNAAQTWQMRLNSTCKLLQQALKTAGAENDKEDFAVIDIEPDVKTNSNLPPTQATNNARPGLSLADLEAQAQRELQQFRQNGGKGHPFSRK